MEARHGVMGTGLIAKDEVAPPPVCSRKRPSGVPRSRMLAIGHGDAEWTKNLEAAGGRLLLTWPGQGSVTFQAVPLAPVPERERAIQATGQHPFPGNLIYGLVRRHVRAAGRYYRLELKSGE